MQHARPLPDSRSSPVRSPSCRAGPPPARRPQSSEICRLRSVHAAARLAGDDDRAHLARPPGRSPLPRRLPPGGWRRWACSTAPSLHIDAWCAAARRCACRLRECTGNPCAPPYRTPSRSPGTARTRRRRRCGRRAVTPAAWYTRAQLSSIQRPALRRVQPAHGTVGGTAGLAEAGVAGQRIRQVRSVRRMDALVLDQLLFGGERHLLREGLQAVQVRCRRPAVSRRKERVVAPHRRQRDFRSWRS